MSRPLDAEKLLAYRVPAATDDYDPRDAILYALGIGAGLSDTIDETAFLYERRLQVVPTMAVVLGTPGFWAMDPACGIDWANVLYAEERLRILQPLDPSGTVVGASRVTDLADKGPGKSALIRSIKDLRTPSGTLMAETVSTWIVRGGGGFGGERELPGDALPEIPDRDPDFAVDLPTSLNQAAIYRLSGDRNPLHIDPEFARGVGFDRPILHGLSTLGVTARAVIHACCDSDTARLREIAVRFTAPVLPGDTIRTLIWQDGEHVQFRAEAIERGVRVIDNGTALCLPGGQT